MDLPEIIATIRHYTDDPSVRHLDQVQDFAVKLQRGEIGRIEAMITSLYNTGDPIIQGRLIELAQRGLLNFSYATKKVPGGESPLTTGGVVYINFENMDNFYGVSINGQYVKIYAIILFAHELSHQLGSGDPVTKVWDDPALNSAEFDYYGGGDIYTSATRFEHHVAEVLGIGEQKRAGYLAGWLGQNVLLDPFISSYDDFFSSGINYTEGRTIDVLRLGHVSGSPFYNFDDDKIYTDSRTDGSRDLVFGFGTGDILSGPVGGDDIRTGDGDDVIYGGSSDDEIDAGDDDDLVFAGGGNDEIVGGKGFDVIDADSDTSPAGSDILGRGDNDKLTYQKADFSVQVRFQRSDRTPGGNTDNSSLQIAKFSESGGSVGTDIVLGVEKVIGSKFADMIILDGKTQLGDLRAVLVDLGSQAGGLIDTVNARDFGGQLKFDLRNTSAQTVEGGGLWIAMANVEAAVGTDGDDEIRGGLYQEGRGGIDILIAAADTRVIITGSKDGDTIIDDGVAEVVQLNGGSPIVYLGTGDEVQGDSTHAKIRRPGNSAPTVARFAFAESDPIKLPGTPQGVLLVGGEEKAPPANPCEPSTQPDEGDGKSYIAADGTKYTLASATLNVDYGDGTVHIQGFRNGDAGIRLKDARPDMDQAECQRDPLIIDLDGDRNVVRELFDSFAYFDLDNDGFRERVAWTLPADGFLVRDLNANGIIDNGTEMFGSGRTEPDAAQRPELLGTAGFAELRLLDSNGDGLISAADADFQTLRVWIDANGDAETDAGELKSLEELGLVSISLTTFESDDLDCGCDGTEVTFASNALFADGSVRNVYDAFLSIDQYDSREIVGDVTVPAGFAELPFLLGTGSLSDLDVAMARDPALEEMVRAFAALDVSKAHEVTRLVEAILLRWTGADTVAADSRGPNINAQWLRAIEVISGSDFNQARIGPNPRGDAAAILILEWQEIVQRTTGKLLGQTELGETLMPQLSYAAAAFFQAEEGTTIDEVIATLGLQSPTEPVEQLKYWKAAVSAVLQYGPALGLTESELLAAFDAHSAFSVPLSASELAKLVMTSEPRAKLAGLGVFPQLGGTGIDWRDLDVLMADADGIRLDGGAGDDIYVVHSDTRNVSIALSSGTDRLVLLDMNRAEVGVTASLSNGLGNFSNPDDIRIEVRLHDATSDWSMAFDVLLDWSDVRQSVSILDFADAKNIKLSELLKDVEIELPAGRVYFISGNQSPGQRTASDDVIFGSEGDDNFLLVPGEGADVFINQRSPGANDDVLTIQALRADVRFQIGANAADLLVLTEGGQALVVGQFRKDRAIERFVFADGSEVTAAEVLNGLLTGTTGADVIEGTIANDIIDGRGGADILRGDYGNDVYRFALGYGGLRIADALGTNTIDLAGIASNQVHVLRTADQTLITIGKGSDSISIAGNQTNFVLAFANRTVSLAQLLLEQGQAVGNPGAGMIVGSIFSDYDFGGTAGDDVIFGVGNYDVLSGYGGNDTYVYAGAQWLELSTSGGGGYDVARPTVQFTWNDVILLPSAIAFEGETFGSIYHSNQYVTATGLSRFAEGLTLDGIVFADGRFVDFSAGWKNDGTAGADILFNFNTAASTFLPGAGDDRMFSYGVSSTKTVVLQEGFGHDVWYHQSNFQIDMTAFALDDRISFARKGDDLVISVDGDSNSMTVVDAFHPYASASSTTVRNAASVVNFSATSLSLSQIAARIAVATSGSDMLFDRADLDGGAGDDTLIGSNDANIYHFGRGYGNDVIKEQCRGAAEYTATDVLVMHGLGQADVTFRRHPADPKSIVITIKDTGETLVLDGTPWDGYTYLGSDLSRASNFNDRSGAHWIEQIQFVDGTISQRDIEQQLLDAERTEGDDTLVSFGSPDPTSGLAGSVLDGGAGNDTYINDFLNLTVRFGPASGHDTVRSQRNANPNVTVRLDGLSAADVSVETEIRDRTAYTIIRAADGSSLAFNHSLGSGSITVVDEAGVSRRVFQEGGLVANLVGTSGKDYLVSSLATTMATNPASRPSAVVETFDGGAGDDVIQGYGGADVVKFGRGDGTDTLLESRPMGSSRNQLQTYTIQFRPNIFRENVDIAWVLDGSGRVAVTIKDTGDKLLLNPENFGALVFDDGKRVQTTNTGNGAELISFNNLLPAATAGNDILLLRGQQTVSSGAGDDTIYFVGGGAEWGTISFGAGDGHDTFVNRTSLDLNGLSSDLYSALNKTAHHLTLRGITSLDQIRLRQAEDDPDDVIIEIIATGDTLRLVDQLGERSLGYTDGNISEVRLGNGTFYWFYALHPRIILARDDNTDNVISTGSSGGILNGGGGFDTLRGGIGDDTYIFGRAFDEDVIADAGGSDVLLFEDGIALSDVVFTRTGGDRDDLLIEVLGTERLSMTIENQFSLTTSCIEAFRFSDGTMIRWDDIPGIILRDAATSGNDVIEGFSTSDRIDGLSGNDRIAGRQGDDTIIGGSGRDTAVYSGSRDQYVVSTLNGVTSVKDLVAGRDGTDTLIGVEDLVFERDGSTLALLPANAGPTASTWAIAGQEDQDLVIGRTTLLALASDADGDPLKLSVGGAIHGKVWVGIDGNIRFRPNPDFNGTASFNYTVYDPNGGEATATVAVQVAAANDAPVATNAFVERFSDEDALVSIDLGAGLFADVDGDPLAISVTLADGTPAPAWLAVADRVLTGTPPTNFNGVIDLRLTASDGDLHVQSSLKLVIRPVNDAPVLQRLPENIQIRPCQAFASSLAADLFVDPEGDEIGFRVLLANGSELPDWLTVEGLSLSGIAPADFLEPLQLAVVADDGRARSFATFGLVPVSNAAPELSHPLGTIEFDEDTFVSFAIPADTFSDSDGDNLSLSARLPDGGELPVWLTFQDGILSGTPPQDFNGALNIHIVANDGELSATAPLHLAIRPANDAPVVAHALPDLSLPANQPIDWLVPYNAFADVDGDALTFSASLADGSALPNWLTFAGGRLTGQAPAGYSGSQTIRITASDGEANASDELVLTLLNSNAAPNAEDDGLFIGLQAQDLVIVAADLLVNDTDENGDPLSIVSVGGASYGQVTLNADGNIVFTFDSSFTGAATFSYVVSDGSAQDTATVSVRIDSPFVGWSQGSSGDDKLFGNHGETNRIFGGAGNDMIKGGQEADWLAGGDGADHLIGLSGDDHFWGNAGDDQLNGSGGFDTAYFFGLRSSYSIRTVNGTVQVVDNAPAVDGDDGTDTISSIELLSFKNGETASVISPIILDLDGDGVETVSARNSNARFDLDGDGLADDTSWVGKDDGFLYLDRNGDGTVSGAAEITFIDDLPGAKSDLAGLRAFDTNGDGKLDAGDERFGEFGVWRDANGNGKVEAHETKSLAAAGVVSIGLAGTAVNGSYEFGDAAILNAGTFTLADGTTREFADAALTYFSARSNRPVLPVWAQGDGRFRQAPKQQYLSEQRSVERVLEAPPALSAKFAHVMPYERMAFTELERRAPALGSDLVRKLALMRQDLSSFGADNGNGLDRPFREATHELDWHA